METDGEARSAGQVPDANMPDAGYQMEQDEDNYDDDQYEDDDNKPQAAAEKNKSEAGDA